MKKWHHIRETVTVYDSECQMNRAITVSIKIDVAALSRLMGVKAMRSKASKSSALYATVIAEIEKKIN